jgi:hypothetical protein
MCILPVSAQQGSTVDPGLYGGMRWRSVGPSRGGRSLAVGGSESRPLEYWFGTTGGGAWKTTDGGSNWAPMTDGKINTSSIGSLAVCQSNPDVVYIGGGESDIRDNIARLKIQRPGLLEVVRKGNVSIANPLGSSILENTGLMAFMHNVFRYFLNEDPVFKMVATWW